MGNRLPKLGNTTAHWVKTDENNFDLSFPKNDKIRFEKKSVILNFFFFFFEQTISGIILLLEVHFGRYTQVRDSISMYIPTIPILSSYIAINIVKFTFFQNSQNSPKLFTLNFKGVIIYKLDHVIYHSSEMIITHL